MKSILTFLALVAGLVRLFLPAQGVSVELDSIELTSGGQTRRWDF